MKKFINNTLLVSTLFLFTTESHSTKTQGVACTTTSCYEEQTMEAMNTCRDLIKTIEGQDKLWNPKLKWNDFKKKKKIKELDKEMTFDTYLGYINELKFTTGKTQTKIKKIIGESPKDTPEEIKKLGLKVSEELALFKPSCINPVNSIQKHINKRKEVLN